MELKHLIDYFCLSLFLVTGSLFVTSCNIFDEDLPECRLYVKFKYDYNMLFTDAFHTQVDKVELYVFDKEGKFLFMQSEEGDVLATGSYLMEVKLPVGQYRFLAWVGVHESYDVTTPRSGYDMVDMRLRLKREESCIIDKKLEPLWHGVSHRVDFTGTTNQIEVISLIKNTNKVRFVFQGYSGEDTRSVSGKSWGLDMNNYNYEIIESNGYMAYDNSLLDDDILSFRPYYMEQKNSSAAVVELNTMRLMEDRQSRFVVTDKTTGRKVFSINLIDYFAMTAMEGNNWGVQEYLDRQDEHKIVFFFAESSSDLWQAIQIQINGWTWYLQTEGEI